MARKLMAIAAAVLLIGGASITVEAQYDKTGEKRLFPVSGNPDGTLNCAPSCDRLGPCC